MVNVAAGLPKYIASASPSPNASFLVIDGKQNTSQVMNRAFSSSSDSLPRNTTFLSLRASRLSLSVSGPFPPMYTT